MNLRIRKIRGRLKEIAKIKKGELELKKGFRMADVVARENELKKELTEQLNLRASLANMKPNTRKFHALFGWCKIASNVEKGQVVVDIEAKKVTYEKRVGVTKVMERKEDGSNYVRTPINHLFNKREHVSDSLKTLVSVMNAEFVYDTVFGSGDWIKNVVDKIQKANA